MFDVGFSEIVVIAVVALVVVGPEKLPRVARTLGHMAGRLQRYVNEVKADINREIELEELRKLQSEMKQAAHSLEQSVSSAAHEVEQGARSVEEHLTANLTETAAVAEADSAALPATVAAETIAPTSSEQASAVLPPQQPSLPGVDRI